MKFHLFSFIVIILLLAACRVAPATTPVETAPTETNAPAAPATETPTQPPPTNAPTPVSFSPSMTIPIKFRDDHFEPGEITLYIGQEVTLTMTNTHSVSHSFAIGRQVVFRDGVPVGFEKDFFVDGTTFGYDLEGWGVLFLPDDLEDGDMEMYGEYYRAEGNPTDYYGELMILAAKTPERGPAIATLRIQFPVVAEMLGEWEYVCFAAYGQHYFAGEHGRLVIKKP